MGLFGFTTAVLRGLDLIRGVCVRVRVYVRARAGEEDDKMCCDFQTGEDEHIQDSTCRSAVGSFARRHLTFLTIAH